MYIHYKVEYGLQTKAKCRSANNGEQWLKYFYVIISEMSNSTYREVEVTIWHIARRPDRSAGMVTPCRKADSIKGFVVGDL